MVRCVQALALAQLLDDMRTIPAWRAYGHRVAGLRQDVGDLLNRQLSADISRRAQPDGESVIAEYSSPVSCGTMGNRAAFDSAGAECIARNSQI